MVIDPAKAYMTRYLYEILLSYHFKFYPKNLDHSGRNPFISRTYNVRLNM